MEECNYPLFFFKIMTFLGISSKWKNLFCLSIQLGILTLTSDSEEALKKGLRIIVIYHGEITKEFQNGEAIEKYILRVAIGLPKN